MSGECIVVMAHSHFSVSFGPKADGLITYCINPFTFCHTVLAYTLMIILCAYRLVSSVKDQNHSSVHPLQHTEKNVSCLHNMQAILSQDDLSFSIRPIHDIVKICFSVQANFSKRAKIKFKELLWNGLNFEY